MRIVFAAHATLLAVLGVGCEGVDDRPASFGYVHAAVIKPNCTTSNCHSGLTGQAGLKFDDPEATYVYLLGRTCEDQGIPGTPTGNLVVPFEPESSRLMYLLRGDEVDIMPPDTPLPDAEVELIERWILEGAPCD